MSKRNSTFASCLACVALLAFSGGRWPKASSETQTSAARPAHRFVPNADDVHAVDMEPANVLNDAVARLAPDKIAWLEVKLWQRMIDHAGTFEGSGRLLRGPFHTVNLHMQIQRRSRTSIVKCISDGRQFAKLVAVEGGDLKMTLKHLPDENVTSNLNQLIALREAFLQENGCAGPVGLLQTIKDRMHSLKLEEGTWNQKRAVRIQGAWKPLLPKSSNSGNSYVPPYVPQMCRVILDAETLWPHRVEWWDVENKKGKVLVLQIEFRDPVINQPVPQHRWDEEFSIPHDPKEQFANRSISH